MDELLKAITNLVNTGGALAPHALYLYFILKFLEPVCGTIALVGTVKIITTFFLKLAGKYQK